MESGVPGFDKIMVPMQQHLQQHLCNRREPVEMVVMQRFFVVHDVVTCRRLGGVIGSQRGGAQRPVREW